MITIHNPLGIKTITKEDGNIINLNGEKEWSIDYANVEKNTTYTYEIEDINGKKEIKSAKLGNIDKLAPKDFEITTEVTESMLKINAKTEDAEETEEYARSEIDRYEYYVKRSYETDYTKYETNEIEISKGTYSIYVIAYDKAGNLKQSNTVRCSNGECVLYDSGDEMIDITGGWDTSKSQKKSGTEKKENCMKINYWGNGEYNVGYLETTKKIDLTNYTKMYVIATYKSCFFEPHRGDVALVKDSYENIFKFTKNGEKSLYNIDISSYDGEYIISIWGCIDLEVYRIWLE